jgi:hypothetical protein
MCCVIRREFVLYSILRKYRAYGQSAGRSVATRCLSSWAASAAFVHVTMGNLQIRFQETQSADRGYSTSRHFAEKLYSKRSGYDHGSDDQKKLQ